jgi:dephospho-CoA kinase
VSDRKPIPVVGIVGGIGSGKSSIARWVAARDLGVLLINGDEAGHAVLTLPAVRNALRTRFGNQVFDAGGQIDRKALGQIVFGPKDEEQIARRDLERIVHPQIRALIEKQISQAIAAGKTAILLDAAVLFEAGWNDLCFAVVFIDAPREKRLARLQEDRGWDHSEVDSRESSQLSLDAKRNRAQFVIDNTGSLDEAGQKLQQILTEIRTF